MRNIDNDKSANERYCAVIFVKTPVVDDSGLAHAVEHLIFRKSLHSPETSTLFQLTSLTDIKINASTWDGLTCFHCTSQDQHGLETALHYLISGILFPIITQQQLEQEIYSGDGRGVIYRELLGYQSNADYLTQVQILRGDHSKHKIYCHGGVTDCLQQLTVDSVTQYHNQYYRSDNIELFTISDHPDELQKCIAPLLFEYQSCADSNAINKPFSCAKHMLNQDSNPHNEQTKHSVYTWWLDFKFHPLFLNQVNDLSSMVSKYGGKLNPISSDTNALNQFALRVICSEQQIDRIHRMLYDLVPASIKDVESVNTHVPLNSKYPLGIKQLMQLHSRRTREKEKEKEKERTDFTDETAYLRQQLSLSPSVSGFAQIANPINKLQTQSNGSSNSLPSRKNTLCKPLIENSVHVCIPPHNARKRNWSTFSLIEFDIPVNISALCSILDRQYAIEALPLGSRLLINTSEHLPCSVVIPDLISVIEKSTQCQQPNIPSILHNLHSELGQPFVSKSQTPSSFRIINSTDLKQSKHANQIRDNVTTLLHTCNFNNWLARIRIERELRLIARIASFVIGASATFLQPRISGECYSIAALYCDDSDELVFYSAFDINTNQRKNSTLLSLTLLAKDDAFLSNALILAKQKVRRFYQGKYQILSHEQLKDLSLIVTDLYQLHDLEYRLNEISHHTLAQFLRQISVLASE
ncbi:insulinase family protein [Vibrio sinensis]|nr:insulinase family protein [Vibrio sinensis]